MKNSKLITGILAGIGVGALLGILFAPHKGSKTRQSIADGSAEFKDNIKNKFGRFGNAVADKYEGMKSDMKDKANGAKQEVKNSYL